MTNIALIMMCGLPGSGKTTLCQALAARSCDQECCDQGNRSHGQESCDQGGSSCDQKLCDRGNGSFDHNHQLRIIHVCYDDLLPADVERALVESGKWKMYRAQIQSLVAETVLKKSIRATSSAFKSEKADTTIGDSESIDACLRERYDDMVDTSNISSSAVLLLDDNMYYRSMRYGYYQIAREHGAGFGSVTVELPIDEAKKRVEERGDVRVELAVVETMAEKLEKPNKDNQWEKHSIVVNTVNEGSVDTTPILQQDQTILGGGNEHTTKISGHRIVIKGDALMSVIELIHKVLANPVPPFEEIDKEQIELARAVCSKNTVHQADQIMRKLLSGHMGRLKGVDKVTLKAEAARVNRIKQELMDDIQIGRVGELPECGSGDAKNCNSVFFKFVQDMFEGKVGL